VPDFEVFTSRSVREATGPVVTVQRGGVLSLNRDVFRLLGEPAAVELLFDRGAQVMGFRAAEATLSHTYPVRRQKSSSSLLVSGRAFTQYYGIATDVARRYPATKIGDVLAVDLKEDSVTTGRHTEEAAAQ
jgi:hypothetical protein